jgi:exodeoxyribonuclease VII small subunit
MKKKEQTYIEAIAEIEAIIKKIEDSDLNVDELSVDVERASELINFCKSKLYATEENINKMLENISNK